MKRNNMYAEFANAYTEKAYTNLEKRYGWRRSVLNPPLTSLAVECEQLYRVASLIAYGHEYKKGSVYIGLANEKDIEQFTSFFFDERGSNLVIELPFEKESLLGDSKNNESETILLPSDLKKANPYTSTKLHRFSDYQTFTLSIAHTSNLPGQRYMAALLGQIVANYFALKSFRGWVNGKIQVEAEDAVGESWVTLASLLDKQAPSLCQCCGKVLDRRVGDKGGRPSLTCGTKKPSACSSKFNNEKRRLDIAKDPAAIYENTLEQKAREMRWRDKNNGRPLQYPCIHLPLGSDE